MPDFMVVIPSIRQINLDYLEPLGTTPVIVVDDTDGSIEWPAPHVRVTRYNDYDRYLGEDAGLVPRKSPSCKDFGIWLACREGAEVIILLDDDVDLRVTPDFLQRIPVNRATTGSVAVSRCAWVNPLSLLTNADGLYARGYPYEHRGIEPELQAARTVTPLFNEGLWSGTADINGIDKLAGARATDPDRAVTGQMLVAPWRNIPLSIMNVQFHRDLAPAFYQPPDYDLPCGFRIRRHDDVWSMYFLKRLMDRRGDWATVGHPMVRHCKEGDMLQEIRSEHASHLIQGHVTSEIDRAAHGLEAFETYRDGAIALGNELSSSRAPGEWGRVIADYGARCARWARLFQED